ncbi:phage major capsid protein [Oenococcus alcoholitolerans]|uniref:phage major capsid protein n=1 Tax=Oenococcus alcoholitolerans TaxID=931074 RepID=UPI003F71CB35
MNIKEQIKKAKSELKAKIQEARSAVADGKENAEELMKDVESRKTKIADLQKLADAEELTESRQKPEDPDKEARALKEKQEEEQRKINKSQGHKIDNGQQPDVKKEHRALVNAYVHSRGREVRADGQVVSADLGLLIPEDISFQPQDTPNTVVDLSQYVHTFQATTASGKYPVRSKVTDRMYTAAELADNPKLKAASYSPIPWSVDTYRGELDISQEAIDDSAIDLTGDINAQLHELTLNTKNFLIAAQLKAFTAQTVASLDDIKKIINVSLDPAYNKSLIASQSFYQYLDTLKDGNGRYLLQDSITSPSGKVVLGLPVLPVSDTLLGASGEENAFIGDLYRGVLMPLRKETYVNWVTNENYEQKLMGALRTGAATADSASGFFITHTETAPAGH